MKYLMNSKMTGFMANVVAYNIENLVGDDD